MARANGSEDFMTFMSRSRESIGSQRASPLPGSTTCTMSWSLPFVDRSRVSQIVEFMAELCRSYDPAGRSEPEFKAVCTLVTMVWLCICKARGKWSMALDWNDHVSPKMLCRTSTASVSVMIGQRIVPLTSSQIGGGFDRYASSRWRYTIFAL